MTHKEYTFQYPIRNWHTYNQALIARGGITFWIDEASLAAWKHASTYKKRDAPMIYSDTAIQCALVVKNVYGLSLRAAQGFVSSVMSLMNLDLPVPNYSTICRRQASLNISLSWSSGDKPRHIVIDATGLRVYGEGTWHIHKHGSGQRRVWRKFHLGVDEQTKEILASHITTSHVHDSRILPSLLDQISGKVCQVTGDGAYDTKSCYDSIGQRGAKATIPPRRNAKQRWCDNSSESLIIRDTYLQQIQQEGRHAWRVASGCSRQSVAENAVFRFKTLFGPTLQARRMDNQKVEGRIKCDILNRRRSLGMPVSERVF